MPQGSARRMGAVVSEMNFYGLPTTITKPGGPDLVEYRRLPTVVARIPFTRTACQTRRYQRKLGDLIGLLELSGAKFAVIEPPSRVSLKGDGLKAVTATLLPRHQSRGRALQPRLDLNGWVPRARVMFRGELAH